MKLLNNLPQKLAIQEQIGVLSELTTSVKTSIVNAVNSLVATVNAINQSLSAHKTSSDHDSRYLKKTDVLNSNAVTETGYALDATEKNASIDGTLANQIDALNATFTNEYNSLNSSLSDTYNCETGGYTETVYTYFHQSVVSGLATGFSQFSFTYNGVYGGFCIKHSSGYYSAVLIGPNLPRPIALNYSNGTLRVRPCTGADFNN